VPTDRKEAHERAEHRSRMKKDTFETVAAERAKELEAIRQRTAELRRLGATAMWDIGVFTGAEVAEIITK